MHFNFLMRLQGGNFARLQEKAYHIADFPFKVGAVFHPLPEQQAFQQHLRTLAQSAVRTVIELVMREELDAFIGATWGECSRQQQRLSQRHLHS
jgi:hypothetical protein